MKKLILFIGVCVMISCKKQVNVSDITSVRWVLKTATINPAITIGGKTTTDYKNAMGEGSCLASNYTLTFLNTGIYQRSSNGALCDMVANSTDQKWTKEGNIITLADKYGSPSSLTLNGNKMISTGTYDMNNASHTIIYTYVAVK